MNDKERLRIATDASLDQWISQVRSEQAAGITGTEPEDIAVRVGQLCGIPLTSNLPQDIKAQPVVILLAFAIHRLLKGTP